MSIENFNNSEYFSYLKANKAKLIVQKQSDMVYTDSIVCNTVRAKEKKDVLIKLAEQSPSTGEEEEPDTLNVTVVCATSNWITSTLDFFTENAFDNSIKARGKNIPHIFDHNQTSTSHVGDVQKVYTAKMPLKFLGLNKKGEVNAVLMNTKIRKDYNENVYKFYKNDKINQHSIGVRLMDMALAINSKEETFKEEKAVWDEFYPQVLNKNLADRAGHFWVTKEADIRENSCVLFGANNLTPVLSTNLKEDLKDLKDLKKEELDSQNLSSLEDVVNMNTFNSESISDSLIKEDINMSENVTLDRYVALEAELKTLKDSQGLSVARAIQEERSRVSAILQSAKTFKISPEVAEEAISKNFSLDMVAVLFTRLAEQKDASTSINTNGGNLSSADQSTFKNLKDETPADRLFFGLEQAEKIQKNFEGVE